MCPSDIRNVSAYLHNFAVRWPEGKAMVKLSDLRRTTLPDMAKIENPDVRELMACAHALVEATNDMTDEGMTIRWTPQTRERVGALVPRVIAALKATRKLSDAHFNDERHSSGRENLLRERQGYYALFGESEGYHHTVELVDAAEADLVHTRCGTGLRLHQHFKDELARDPTFYGLVWCQTCGRNLPFSQFEHVIQNSQPQGTK